MVKKPPESFSKDLGGGWAVYATETIEAGDEIDGLHGLLIINSELNRIQISP